MPKAELTKEDIERLQAERKAIIIKVLDLDDAAAAVLQVDIDGGVAFPDTGDHETDFEKTLQDAVPEAMLSFGDEGKTQVRIGWTSNYLSN